MIDPGSCRLEGDDEVLAGHCITCGDVGIEMSIVALDATGLARCAGPDGPQTVEMGLLQSARPGDRVLVHAGTAIASLEARR